MNSMNSISNSTKAKMSDILDGRLDARPFLRPVVAARAHHERKTLLMRACAGETSGRLIANDIVIRIAVAVDGLYSYPPAWMLSSWGLSFDTALRVAVDNVATAGHAIWNEEHKGLFLTTPRLAPRDVVAALLLDPSPILRLNVKGRHLIAVMTSDIMAVTGSEDEDGLMWLTQVAHRLHKDEHFVSPVLYAIEDGRLEPCGLPHAHPAQASLRGTEAVCDSFWSIALATTINSHSSGPRALPAFVTPTYPKIRHGRWTADVFPLGDPRQADLTRADLSSIGDCLGARSDLARTIATAYEAIVRRLQGRGCAYLGTFTIWPRGFEPLLLPKADLIAFFDPSTNTIDALADWDSVDGVASPIGMWPPRYLAERYPESDEMGQMRSVDS